MKVKHLLLSGGGTLGPTTPLLAVVEYSRRLKLPYDFSWVGTKHGPERLLVAEIGLRYHILISGKWRRYRSIKNLFAPILTLVGFGQALWLLWKVRPDAVLSAGGYVSVPLVYAAWCYRIPIIIHGQDSQEGLANRLMRPVATLYTSVWSKPKVETIGNLIRPSIYAGDAEKFRRTHDLTKTEQVVLVIGGGTGALSLNRMVVESLPQITRRAFVVHITGIKKGWSVTMSRYLSVEFAKQELADYYAVADIVISRAGMASLSELAALGKPAILVPLPDTHQEKNALVFVNAGAAVVLNQKKITAEILSEAVVDLLDDPEKRQELSVQIHKLIPDGTKDFLQRLGRLLKV